MAGRVGTKAKPVAYVQPPAVEDAQVQRALEVLTSAIQEIQSRPRRDVIVNVDLVVGTNKISHGLARPCVGYNLTITDANVVFTHAINKSNPRPDLEVWVTVVGTAQTATTIEVY